MKFNWKQFGTIATGTFLPALVAALSGQPVISAHVFLNALGSAAIVTFAVCLKSPIVDPGVKR